MRVIVNGEDRETPEDLTVAGLLNHLGLPADRVAIERNREILPRARWSDTRIEPDDQFEIVQFVGGG